MLYASNRSPIARRRIVYRNKEGEIGSYHDLCQIQVYNIQGGRIMAAVAI